MKYCLLIPAFFLYTALPVSAQESKNRQQHYYWTIDIGVNQSIGKNKTDLIQSSMNPVVWVEYYKQQGYESPGLRARTSILYTKNNDFFVGFQSGITWRFGQVYGGMKYSLVSVPVQVRFTQTLFESQKLTFQLDAAGGANIFGNQTDNRIDKTGPLVNAGIQVKIQKMFVFNIGYEHQVDNGEIKIQSDPSWNIQAETIKYKTKRPQLYCSIGISI